MTLDVTFKNLKPREEVRRRAVALYTKLERFLEPAAEGSMIVFLDHGVTGIELTVTAHGQVFQASDEDEDLRTALDRAFHTLEHALRRAKEKRVDRWQRGPEKEDGFVAAGAEDDDHDEPAVV